MDPRKDFEEILKTYGHDIYLQRKLETVEATGPYRDLKHRIVLEQHTVREMNYSSMSMADIVENRAEGVSGDFDRVYWFKWDVNPDEGDLIYDRVPETYIDAEGRKQIKPDVQRFTIKMTYPHRGLGGRIEFWACGAEKSELS
jgi:hypothetical protein